MYFCCFQCLVHDQPEEVLKNWMGKVKDVVQIALRSDPTLDVR